MVLSKNILLDSCFLKGQPRPLFCLFSVISSKQYNFLQQINEKNVMSIQYTVQDSNPWRSCSFIIFNFVEMTIFSSSIYPTTSSTTKGIVILKFARIEYTLNFCQFRQFCSLQKSNVLGLFWLCKIGFALFDRTSHAKITSLTNLPFALFIVAVNHGNWSLSIK